MKDSLHPADRFAGVPPDPDNAQLALLLESGCWQSEDPDRDLIGCCGHIAALVRSLSGSAIGVVSLLDDPSHGDGVVRACNGLPEPKRTVAGEGALSADPDELLRLSAQSILQRQPLLVGDTLTDLRLRHHPLVQGPPHVRFLLSHPLIAPDGSVLGVLGCFDPEPRLLPDPALAPLGRLAALVVRLLERRRLRRLLADTDRALSTSAQPTAPQLLQREQITQMLESGFRLGLHSGYAVLRCELKDHDRLCATHGSQLGALVLEEITRRFLRVLPLGASAARFTDAEFLVVLPHGSREAVAAGTARRLIDQLSEEIHTHDLSIPVTIAIGIVMVQAHHASAGSVLADAAIARRMASRSLLSQFCFLDAKNRRLVRDDYALEASFRDALRLRDLVPFFQPIIDLASGEPVGFEALARWPGSDGGIAQPGTFLPMAQRSGLTGEMDLQIIRKALDAMPALGAAAQGRSLVMSLNLSAQLLSNSLLRGQLLELLGSRCQTPLWRLQVEIVEEALQDISPDFDSFLSRISSFGVGIAIDDFGTGYSSLSRLNALPIQMFKIDRCFVQQIDHAFTPSDQLLRTINKLAVDLGLGTTAEGVENDEQRAWLLANGILYAQGFHFAPPMPLDEAIAWLQGLPSPRLRPAEAAGVGDDWAQGVRPERVGQRLRGALRRLLVGR
ncbi:MAG: sensor domain-containing phosphodiesterase [Synechococcaceae cyanobacterium]|nr:sensor domain-containing phosphodiesterase [Synechococcaceae cyanobacterium]